MPPEIPEATLISICVVQGSFPAVFSGYGESFLRGRLDLWADYSTQGVTDAPHAHVHAKVIEGLDSARASLETQIRTAARRLAIVENDHVSDVQDGLTSLKEERRDIERRLAEERRRAPKTAVDLEQEVSAAMALLDQLESVTAEPAARRDLTLLLRKLNLWPGLEFTEGIKGRTRRMRKLVRGVLAFDEDELPVPPFGRDRVPDNGPVQQLPNVKANPARGEVAPMQIGGEGTVVDHSRDGNPGHVDVNSHREGVSFTKVNRGDWI